VSVLQRNRSQVAWYWLRVAFAGNSRDAFLITRLTRHRLYGCGDGLPRNMIEQRIFASELPFSIVTTDSSLVLLQNTLHTDISIADYVGGHTHRVCDTFSGRRAAHYSGKSNNGRFIQVLVI